MITSEVNRQQVKAIFKMIRDAGGEEIYVSFDGGGDSGSIDACRIINTNGDPVELKFIVDYTVFRDCYINGEWKTESELVQLPVEEVLETMCEDVLEKMGIDWYNNEGGFGELYVDLNANEVSLDVTTRHTENYTTSIELDDELKEKE
jgi:hypothetical protein